jgi:zinc protease
MMKRLAIISAGVAAMVACGGPSDTVILSEPDSPFIAFNIWVKAGSQNDPAGKEGLAALTANLLSDGATEQDSYEAILEKLYPMAAGYGYNVDKEMTVFRGRIHRDNLDTYYELFRNSLLSPAFRQEDFDRVKSQRMNFLERSRRFSRDEELSKELLFTTAYTGTPYEHPEEGYVESVRSITLDDVRDFYNTYYINSNVVVGVGGGYAVGFPQQVRADMNTLPEGTVAAVPAPEPAMPDGFKVLIVEKETDATAISLGFPISLVRGDPDFFALMAVNSWFGEHRNSYSHLYQVIREARGMNYGDYSYIEAYPLGYTTQVPPTNVARRSHLFEIWIRPISLTAPGNLHERTLFATRAALRELKDLVDNGMDPDTVEATRQFLRNYTVNWGSTITRRLAYAIDDEFYSFPGDGYLNAIRPGLEELTADRVQAAIERHLQYDNMYIIFITADAEGMKQKLLSGVATPITYAGERSAEHMAEDELIASFPIPVDEDDITIIGINEVRDQRGIRAALTPISRSSSEKAGEHQARRLFLAHQGEPPATLHEAGSSVTSNSFSLRATVANDSNFTFICTTNLRSSSLNHTRASASSENSNPPSGIVGWTVAIGPRSCRRRRLGLAQLPLNRQHRACECRPSCWQSRLHAARSCSRARAAASPTQSRHRGATYASSRASSFRAGWCKAVRTTTSRPHGRTLSRRWYCCTRATTRRRAASSTSSVVFSNRREPDSAACRRAGTPSPRCQWRRAISRTTTTIGSATVGVCCSRFSITACPPGIASDTHHSRTR